jgi:hypothetical protein
MSVSVRRMYDFKVIDGGLPMGPEKFEAALNQATSDGWELVHVVGLEGAVWAILRRPADEERTGKVW